MRCSAAPWRADVFKWLRLGAVVALSIGGAAAWGQEADQTPVDPRFGEVTGGAVDAQAATPQVRLGRIVSMDTAWYPRAGIANQEKQLGINREIVRQGVLLAVREELGLLTRDATLQEPLVETPSVSGDPPLEPLHVDTTIFTSGKFSAVLYGAGTTHEQPIWSYNGNLKYNKRTLLAETTTLMTAECAAIVARLRADGAAGEAAAWNDETPPPPGVEQLLGEMNFVSQYAAVRAAHQAIRDQGASPALLGVLARGYAHLGLLTNHLWSSQSDAFAARALLYAERMVDHDDSARAHWHRAYVQAVIGAHGAALEELEAIAQLEPSAEKLPAWTELVAPTAHFEMEKLAEIGGRRREVAEVAALLQWELYRAFMVPRWDYEKGVATMRACPEAYGVYNVLAHSIGLKVERVGAYSALAAFARFLPARVAKVPGLPDATRQLAAPAGGVLGALFGGGSEASLSLKPKQIADSLIAATTDDATAGEFTWAVLGELISEEQFVEAANFMHVAQDATESPMEGVVAQFLPLVEGHRYEPLIASYAQGRRVNEAVYEAMRDMRVVDPRGNMHTMFVRIWNAPYEEDCKGRRLNGLATWNCNHTLPGLVEGYWYAAGTRASFSVDNRKNFADAFTRVSPNSPIPLRVELEVMEEPTIEKLAAHEQKLRDDPVAWLDLGTAYYNLSDWDGAERCYKRSNDLSPSYDATQFLASSYVENGKPELWQPTLEAYLEVEDLSLDHARVHNQLADDRIAVRDWRGAEPHALAAAQTWSAWGLMLASRVYEGLQEWEKSEYFAAQSSTNYPSYYSGTDWYFWCRRTGRGQLAQARATAQRSVELATQSTDAGEAFRAFAFRVLEGDVEGAVAGLEEQFSRMAPTENGAIRTPRMLYTMAAADATGNAELKTKAIGELRAAMLAVPPDQADAVAYLLMLCDLWEGKDVTDDSVKMAEATVAQLDPYRQSRYWYFLGAAMDHIGRGEDADRFLRRSAHSTGGDMINATLAAALLIKRNADTGPLPPEFAELEAKAKAEADARAAVEAAAGGDEDGEDAADDSEDDPTL